MDLDAIINAAAFISVAAPIAVFGFYVARSFYLDTGRDDYHRIMQNELYNGHTASSSSTKYDETTYLCDVKIKLVEFMETSE